MRKIKISYSELDDEEIRNSVMLLALDSPKFKQDRKLYLHELMFFDEIEKVIKDREEEYLQFDIINNDFTPYYIKVSNETYDDLKVYLENDTEYEECKWYDDVAILNLVLNMCRKDPKYWEI